LYDVSVPFTLEDFETGARRVKKAAFVGLFSDTVASASEEDPPETEEVAPEEVAEAAQPQPEPEEETLSIEAETRKVFEDAYVQGEKAGYEMGMRRAESNAKRLEKQVEEVLSFRQELTQRYEKLSVDLALAFTEALVLRECAEHKGILAAMVRKAMEMCEDRDGLVVRMRSEDVQYLEGLSSDQIKIVSDDTLKEPGFVIETNMGDIDGKISTQIEELKNTLAEYYGE
jgi:flagellar assembly protein FliH